MVEAWRFIVVLKALVFLTQTVEECCGNVERIKQQKIKLGRGLMKASATSLTSHQGITVVIELISPFARSRCLEEKVISDSLELQHPRYLQPGTPDTPPTT
jgi:hypothetical protein